MTAVRRVLVVAEGRSEIGDLDAITRPTGKRAKAVVEGFVPPVVRRELAGVELEARKVTVLGRFGVKAKLEGHADRAAKALALASTLGFDVLVFVKDVDREGGVKKSAKERAAKLEAMHREIEAGFDVVKNAQGVARVKGTPCRMIEAWALGDPAVVNQVADRRAKREPCPPAPEELWGDKTDPASGYPKNVFARVTGREATAEVLEEIAREADLEEVGRRCPQSFAPFLAELRAVASPARVTRGTPKRRGK